MASIHRSALRCLRWTRPANSPPQAVLASTPISLRFYSAEASPKTPKALPTIKNDLKVAMRAKDAPRLAVLRNILAANLNASKTSTPIQTDVQLVALLRKLRKPYEDAAADAEKNGRPDLVEKEKKHMEILDSYVKACGLESISAGELQVMVEEAAMAAREAGATSKDIMGKVMASMSSKLDGKDVDKKSLAELVKKAVS